MAEELVLTTPVVVTTTTDKYKVVLLVMDIELLGPSSLPPPPAPPLPPPAPGMVRISVRDNLGVMQEFQFFGTLAQDMIKFINTGDFTARSLNKRILEKLSTMGVLVGTVAGTPDMPSAPTGLE